MRVINVASTIALLLMTSSLACHQGPEAEEIPSCLKVRPEVSCDVIITYPDPDLETLECNYLVPKEDGDFLTDKPKLEVVDPQGEFPMPVLVVMFDPDVPTNNLEDGFVHWVARGKLYEDGSIWDVISLPELDYHPPNPPADDAAHRYQVFVFRVDADHNIAANPSPAFIRLDHLCDFISRNRLGKPIASTQFRYKT